jgi:cytochrome c
MLAVCVHCGNIKRNLSARCAICHFQPQTDEDKARAFILSTAYEIDGEYRGMTKEQLTAIAAAVGNGRPYAFDQAEIQSVVAYAKRVLTVPARRLIIDGVRWLLLPFLVLMAVHLSR